MTALGIQIGWLAARVTVFAICAASLERWSGRRAARSGVILLVAAMTIVLTLSVFAIFPAPDYSGWSPLSISGPSTGVDNRSETVASDAPDGGGFTLSKILTAL